jgi:hypothetical protein
MIPFTMTLFFHVTRQHAHRLTIYKGHHAPPNKGNHTKAGNPAKERTMKTSTNTTTITDTDLTTKGLELTARNEQFQLAAHQIHENCQSYLDSLKLDDNLYQKKITISCTPKNSYSKIWLSSFTSEMPDIKHTPKECYECSYDNCNNCIHDEEKSCTTLTPSLFREIVKALLIKRQEVICTKESTLIPWQSEGLPSTEEIAKLRRQVEDRIRKDTKALVYCLKVLG